MPGAVSLASRQPDLRSNLAFPNGITEQ
jgi:hypothetical protein